MIEINCPDCGGTPTIEPTMYGRAYYTLCSVCGWEGDTRDVEVSPAASLDHWLEKAEEHLNQEKFS